MGKNFGPLYEVTHTLNREIAADFDLWLAEHAEEMLSIQGISRAVTYVADDAEGGRRRRVTHYCFATDEDLENYLAGPAEAMRASAKQQFGENFSVSRRLLHQSGRVDELEAGELCRNCGTTLLGQYCGNCGQRARSRLISIWQLIREAFGDLFELDSRIWRTLIPLFSHPGRLTQDYLEGRRVRFMPPFRTYLVLSIVFFLIAFFDPAEEFGVLLDAPEDGVTAVNNLQAPRSTQELRSANQSVSPPDEGNLTSEEQNRGVNLQFGDGEPESEGSCDDLDSEDWPAWLTRRISTERMKMACERVIADDGKAFAGKLLDNVPAALIALLPLMAVALKVLYPLSKRYYVEHVLFVVHFHAFVFLILALQVLFSRLIGSLGWPDTISSTTGVAVSIYIPVYFFMAMRRVYGQSLSATLFKFIAMLLAYFSGLLGILIVTAVFAALAI